MPTAEELEGMVGDEPDEKDDEEGAEPAEEAKPQAKAEVSDVPPPRRRHVALDAVKELKASFEERQKAWDAEREESRRDREESRRQADALREEIRASRTTAQAPKDDHEDRDFGTAISDLRKKMWAAASRNDTDGYDECGDAIRELEHERTRRQVMAEVDKRIASSKPPEVPEIVRELEEEFSDVRRVKGWREKVAAEDRWLAADGEPDGPARYRKAFENVAIRAKVRSPQSPVQRPSAEQRARSLPTGGTSGGSAGNGKSANMPPGWEAAAKAARMSPDEYKRIWVSHHPEHVIE